MILKTLVAKKVVLLQLIMILKTLAAKKVVLLQLIMKTLAAKQEGLLQLIVIWTAQRLKRSMSTTFQSVLAAAGRFLGDMRLLDDQTCMPQHGTVAGALFRDRKQKFRLFIADMSPIKTRRRLDRRQSRYYFS
ncbi:hypothetical protein [Cohnella nanjingensis]|nr:hypothetical protein [Cohnella nanjingensis]